MFETLKLSFRAGINTDETPLVAEGWYVSANGVRFWQGGWEVIGGWAPLVDTLFSGIVRGAVQWNNLDGDPRLAFGTESNVYAVADGVLRDISPILSKIRLPTDPFSKPAGLPVDQIIVQHPAHGALAGETVTFLYVKETGTLVLTGSHVITEVRDPNTYVITKAGNPSWGSNDYGGGDQVEATISLPAGRVDATENPWGLPRTWSMDRFGEMLIASPDGRKIFGGFVQSAAPANIVINGDFATTSGWARGTGWSISSGRANLVSSSDANLSQSISGKAKEGHIYRLEFQARDGATTGQPSTLQVQINAGNPAALIEVVSTFEVFRGATFRDYAATFVMPAAPLDIVFHGVTSSSSNIQIDNVSMVEVELAPIDQAPTYNNAVFVDPHGVVVALGTVEADGDFNPMCVRNSALGDIRLWAPDVDNVASEIVLSGGGYLIAGCRTRDQNLIWSDTATFVQQWIGNIGEAFAYKQISDRVGLYARFAFAEADGLVLFIGSDEDFKMFDGARIIPLDCPVAKDFFGNVNVAQKSKIATYYHNAKSEWHICYPRGENTECSHKVVYNLAEKHWTHHVMARTTGLDIGPFGYPLEFATNGKIYKHEFGTKADGQPMTWHLTTGFSDVRDGTRLMSVNRHWMDIKDQTGRFQITHRFRNTARSDAIQHGPQIVDTDTQELFLMALGRQWQIHYESYADSEYLRMGVESVDAKETGARR